MTVLASGSRGNSAVISSRRTRILVDAGISCRELFKRMAQAGEDPSTLDAILITHEHQDHVQGLSVAARKLGIPVYFTEATHRAWLRWIHPQKRMTYAAWLAERKQAAADRTQALEPQAPAAAQADCARGGPLPEAVPAPIAGAQVASAQAAVTPMARADAPGERVASAPTQADQLHQDHQENPFYREEALADCSRELDEFAEEAASVRQAAQEPCHQPVARREAADPCALPGVEYFRAGARFSIGDIEITPFTIPHDAADPVGFVLEAEGIRVGLATDLGYMPANVSQQLRRCDIVMLESNHDLDMLRDGPYPWSVKQRVLSRVGHLSNAAAAEFLEKSYDGQAAYVVLAHLSESNNLPELARVAAEFALRNRMSLLANKLVLAAQHEPTEAICL